jgi:hypothetical protein
MTFSGTHRLLAVATVALVALAAAAGAGAATRTGPDDRTAALSGSSGWSPGYTISGSFEGTFGRGTYAGTLTTGVAHYTTPTCGPVCSAVTGSITFSMRAGDLSAAARPGSAVVLEDIASHSIRGFSLKLRIVGGTGRYARARGSLTLSYSSVRTHTWVDGVFVDSVTDAGALSGKVQIPAG